MELAPTFLEAGAKVIDLSGAFRLRDADAYQRWYNARHTAPQSACRSGLWIAGILPREDCTGAAGFESRLLSDGCQISRSVR